jgi:hypothetical protein
MKLHGKALSKLNNQIIIIPRTDGDIIFKAAAVLDMTAFEQLCPEPKPPMILRRGETVASADLSDAKYKEAADKRNRLYGLYMIIKSLSATEGLEWETIKMDDPTTWENLDKELIDSGLTTMEKAQIFQGAMRANSLDMAYIDEARKRFFDTERQKAQPQ